MQHHAGRVDHAAQRGPGELGSKRGDLARRSIGASRERRADDLRPPGRDRTPRRLDDGPSRRARGRRGQICEHVNGGELGQRFAHAEI